MQTNTHNLLANDRKPLRTFAPAEYWFFFNYSPQQIPLLICIYCRRDTVNSRKKLKTGRSGAIGRLDLPEGRELKEEERICI